MADVCGMKRVTDRVGRRQGRPGRAARHCRSMQLRAAALRDSSALFRAPSQAGGARREGQCNRGVHRLRYPGHAHGRRCRTSSAKRTTSSAWLMQLAYSAHTSYMPSHLPHGPPHGARPKMIPLPPCANSPSPSRAR
eukprot:scaffold17373_cov116-Isochrysis_galbana.AAC.5